MANKFDDAITLVNKGGRNVPEHLVDAAVYVNDTLHLATATVKDLANGFDGRLVLKVYDRIDRERQRRANKKNADE